MRIEQVTDHVFVEDAKLPTRCLQCGTPKAAHRLATEGEMKRHAESVRERFGDIANGRD